MIVLKIISEIILIILLYFFAYRGKNKICGIICTCILIGILISCFVYKIIEIIESDYIAIMYNYSKSILPYMFDILLDSIIIVITTLTFGPLFKNLIRLKGSA